MANDHNLRDDQSTNLATLKATVRQFVTEREWEQFHTPKNLSMALTIEAGELMEHFQWLTPEASRELDPSARAEVGEEIADVFCYLLAIANELEIDLAATFASKMDKNRQKYPVSEFRGRYGSNDPNPVSGQA